MSNSIKYNEDVAADVANELNIIKRELSNLSSILNDYANSQPDPDAIDSKVERMAIKYDEEGNSYFDENDQNYYDAYYGRPLKNAIINIRVMSGTISKFEDNVDSIYSSVTAIQGAVQEFEEINPIPEEAEDIITENVTKGESHSYVNFGNISENVGVGKADINIDLNGDGVPDTNIDTNGDGKADLNIDLNGDGVPDVNIDINGDGKADLNIDTTGDGRADLNIDIDGDGKADINIDLNGDGKPDMNEDVTGDGEADVNVDTNEDGQRDTNVDVDGDGKADTNIDTNGDGIADTNIDLDGDGRADVNVDINGDGQADLNIDSNGDGIADTNIDANRNGIIDSKEEKEEGTIIPILPIPPIPKDEDDEEDDDDESEEKDKTGEENADDLVDIGEVVIPDIGGEDDVKPRPEEGNKGAGAISNIGTAIADSVTSVEDELLDGVIEAEEKPSIPDALLGGNGSHGMSEFDASGSYNNAQGPAAAQAGVGVAGVAALGIAAASGGTAISGVIEENDEESDLTKDELGKRKRIRTIITSSSLVILSLGFTLTQILRPGSIITILLFGIAILISAVASVFGTNIGKTVTTITSLSLLFITFLLAAFNVVSPLGYIIALIALLTIFLVVYIFDLFKEFVDNKVMIPSFVAVVTLNAFGLLKVFNVVNWLIYLLLAALGIAVYLWYERYYGQGFEVLNKLKNEDKRKFFN